MYKNGLSFLALHYCGDAKVYLEQLLARHPDTAWKKDAERRLDELKRHRGDKTKCRN